MSQTDSDYVRLCLDGHPEMFRQLVVRYEAPLIRHLLGRLGNENEAAEAAQEAMVRAYFALPKLRKIESFASWLLGIGDRVVREMIHARCRHARALTMKSKLEKSAPDTGSSIVRDKELSRAVADLPETYRDVIVLRFYGGQSCAEISANLGVSVGTITSRLSRAYSLLRATLQKYAVDQEF